MLKKKYDFLIKFKLNSEIGALTAKMSTILGQRRLNSNEIFSFLQYKLSELYLTSNIEVTVFIFVFSLEDYIIHIKMPSLSTLLKKTMFLKKNSNTPGYLFSLKKYQYAYTLTPYLLYEILLYKYTYENTDNISLQSYFLKSNSSLRSKGMSVYIC